MHPWKGRTGIAAAAAALAFAVVGGVTPRATGLTGRSAESGRHAAAHPAAAPFGKIKHVVVIFQENRSFDEVLGYFCTHPTKRCNGYVGPVKLQGGITAQMTKSPDVIQQDPPHSINAQSTAVDGGKMDGWGKLGSGCNSPGTNNCLTYYTPAQIPALTTLAKNYVVSDRTFEGQNAPSWGGHIWLATPTQDGFTGDLPYGGNGWGCDANAVANWVSASGQLSAQPSCIPAPPGYLNAAKYPYGGAYKPTLVKNVPTIFDRLDAKHLPWRIYATVYPWSVCPTFGKCLYGPQHNNVVRTSQVLTDAKNGKLPAYAAVLPDGPKCCTGQHPPLSMLTGDNWIGQLVNALQASPDWSSTAIFITYDDCGCFYDHVAPGKNPDGTPQGVRVPMVIVSPYAKHAGTDSNTATFASFLKFTEEAFGLAPIGVNDSKGYDYAGSFNFSAPPSSPRVWPKQQPVPESTTRLVASLPPITDDPT